MARCESTRILYVKSKESFVHGSPFLDSCIPDPTAGLFYKGREVCPCYECAHCLAVCHGRVKVGGCCVPDDCWKVVCIVCRRIHGAETTLMTFEESDDECIAIVEV